MKKFITAAALVVIFALAWFTLQLYLTHRSLADSEAEMLQQLALLNQQSGDLKSDLRYLQDPSNLEKELRSRTNYKSPGEKMIIVVPESGTSTSH